MKQDNSGSFSGIGIGDVSVFKENQDENLVYKSNIYFFNHLRNIRSCKQFMNALVLKKYI
jgi:TRAP-type uncharacterized transport system substrate-binding protein